MNFKNYCLPYLSVKEITKQKYNINENNLSNKNEYIEFFMSFLYFLKNGMTEELTLCITKLKYLGLTETGIINFSYGNEYSIYNSLIQCAFILYKNNADEKVNKIFEFLLDYLHD